jgi:hypothetical protein
MLLQLDSEQLVQDVTTIPFEHVDVAFVTLRYCGPPPCV